METTRSTPPSLDSSKVQRSSKDRGLGLKILAALSLSVAIYGSVEWMYVAVCSLVVPATLPLPLTHVLPFLREDTSGVISFILSFCGFTIYWILRDNLYSLVPRTFQLWIT